MEGSRLLLVMALQADGHTPEGDPILAVDRLGAGHDATVMVTSDGIGTRELSAQQDLAGAVVGDGIAGRRQAREQ